jgi:2-polyprenyl-3-methyl-5-hydroxy-6-metoxy-1,4-benzoquinol methylase
LTIGCVRMASCVISRRCPVCGSDMRAGLLRKGDLQIVTCKVCSMVYANPIEEKLATGRFYDQLATPFYLSPNKLKSDYAAVRFERELKLFRRLCQRGRVLDVGCSTGAFLAQLQSRFGKDYEVLGTDVAGPAVDYAEGKGVPVLRESYLTASFNGKQFGAVTFWAVLEHLPNPLAFLSQTALVLEPGGLCFILVPNFQSLAVRLLGSKYRYILPQHLNYFTSATLAGLVEREPRFRVIYSGSSHFNPLVILQDWKRRGQPVSDEERAILLKRTTGHKENMALKPIKWALAAVEAVLASLNLADNIVIVLQKIANDDDALARKSLGRI